MSTEIALNARGMMRPTNMSEAMEFAKLVASSSLVPGPYRNRPADVMLAVQMGAELGLAPMQALQSVAVINGRPSVYGDALMALVRSSPLCESVVETCEGNGDDLTATCTAKRRGQDEPVIARFSVSDAKRAKLWGKSGPWTEYPPRMLQMRARGFALRDAFPDVLRGVITREEAEDYPDVSRAPIDVTPRADLDLFAASASSLADNFAVAPTDDALRITAEQTAMSGAAVFREWWKTLDPSQRDALRPDIAEYQRVAEAADAIAAAANEDPFGLPPAPTEQSSPDGPAERPGASAPADSPTRQGELSPAEPENARDPLVVPLGRRPTTAQIEYYARQLLALIGEEPLTAPRAALIRAANEGGIGWLKLKAVERYDEVMAAINKTVTP